MRHALLPPHFKHKSCELCKDFGGWALRYNNQKSSRYTAGSGLHACCSPHMVAPLKTKRPRVLPLSNRLDHYSHLSYKMNKLSQSIVLLSSLLAFNGHAQISIDASKIGVQVTGTSTITLNNLTVIGQSKPFSVDFAWDPMTVSFRPVAARVDAAEKWKPTTTTASWSSGSLSFSQDLSGLCASEFGFGHVQADWADVKSWINNDASRAQTFINSAIFKPTPTTTRSLLASYNNKAYGLSSYSSNYFPMVISLRPNFSNLFNEDLLGGTLYSSNSDAGSGLGGGPFYVLCNNKSAT